MEEKIKLFAYNFIKKIPYDHWIELNHPITYYFNYCVDFDDIWNFIQFNHFNDMSRIDLLTDHNDQYFKKLKRKPNYGK